MSFILTSGALLRILVAHKADPISRWLATEEIRPFVAFQTMAQALFAVLNNGEISLTQRLVYTRRYEEIEIGIRSGSAGTVKEVGFDLTTAQILSDLMSVDVAKDKISELDLVPAAIALQHNYTLIVGSELQAWYDFGKAIPKEIGRLNLRSFIIVSG